MTRKIISWLSFMIVLVSLYSCRQEELLTNNDDSISKTITIQQLLKADIGKIPHLQNEIRKLENKKVSKSSSNAKIYTDTEESFSIDTEKALYIENAGGNKTYTFKIVRSENTSGILENLILKDVGNSEFEAFISTYDEIAVQNYKNLSVQELKAHVTMTSIGKRNASDIFGKINANLCQITTLSDVHQVYVPGTICSESLHNYSGIADCTAEVKPTSGYYTFVTEYTTYDSCTGVTGSGTIDTGPYGGYNGGGSFDDPLNPCTVAKPSITKANEILHSTAGQSMDAFLRGKISAANEWNIAIGQTTTGLNTTPPKEGNADSSTADISNLQGVYIGNGHSHSGYAGVPSAGDLYATWEKVQNYPDYKYSFVYGDDAGNPEMYAFVIHDSSLLAAFFAQFPQSENYDPSIRKVKEGSPLGKEFYKAIQHYSEGRSDNSSGENYEPRAIGMAYILEKYNSGISIAKVDANGNLKKINVNVQKITVPASGGAIKEGVKVSKCP